MHTSNILNESSIFPVWPEQSRADPKQIEIEFFWPLTEQLKLDLDFTLCEKPKNYYYGTVIGVGTGGTSYTLANTWATTTSITAANLTLDVDTTTIKTSGKPPLIRRWLYNLLGLKWEIK